jgi:hypothetical protein
MLRAPLDVVGEHRAAGDLLLLDLHRLARNGAQVGVGLVAHRDLVLLGDAEEHADDPHGEHGAQLGDDVEARRADERVEAADAVGADLVLQLGHAPGREHPGHEAAVAGVDRRVLEQQHARGQLDARADDVEDVAAGVGEGLPVPQAPLDVGEARQRPEVVRLVVVGGRLFPQAGVGRVRVGVDVDVVGVEVDGLAWAHPGVLVYF